MQQSRLDVIPLMISLRLPRDAGVDFDAKTGFAGVDNGGLCGYGAGGGCHGGERRGGGHGAGLCGGCGGERRKCAWWIWSALSI